METDFSKAKLFQFLEGATNRGDINVNTAAGLRAAASKLLEDVPDSEDLKSADVDALAVRYRNKHPDDISTASLKTYVNRMTRLLMEFDSYQTDPVNYKAKGRGLGKVSSEKTTARANAQADQGAEQDSGVRGAGNAVATKTLLSMPFPLRDDFVAQIVIPRNITSEEAKRLCAFITTLAADFKG